jgi:hypothetical protein
VVTEDESDGALVDGDRDSLVDGDADSLVENVRPRRATPVETEAGSYTSITVDLCHVGKDVEVGANAPNEKPIETVEPPKWTAVNAREESDGTTVDVPRESDFTVVDPLWESGNASVGALEEPSVTLDSDVEPSGVELGESDNMNVDAVGESNNTMLDVPVESDNATVQLLGESDNGTDVPGKTMAMDVHDTTELDPASEYDMMDLDIPGSKSRVGMEVRGRKSIEAASALYTMSQHHSPPSSGGLGNWQVVNWLRMTRQDGRQGWGAKLSTGIDPKGLLEGWDWVFQR